METLNLTGEWSGVYWIPEGEVREVPLLARLHHDGGDLSGDISEPNLLGHLTDNLYARITGKCSGHHVSFIKT
ncbi:MAG: hypothetical protein AAFV69_02505 [Pseudomonadota bacterium]